MAEIFLSAKILVIFMFLLKIFEDASWLAGKEIFQQDKTLKGNFSQYYDLKYLKEDSSFGPALVLSQNEHFGQRGSHDIWLIQLFGKKQVITSGWFSIVWFMNDTIRTSLQGLPLMNILI